MTSDSEIISHSVEDPAAFGALFDRHAAAIHRYVARRTGPGVADDVVSGTFLIAFERRASFRSSSDGAAPWLFGIATNLLRHHHRHEARTLRAVARMEEAAPRVVDGEADASDADARLEARAALRDVADALRRMPRVQRDTVLLHAWADLTYEQIAVAMEVPVGTVRSRLNRARHTLRAGTTARTTAFLTGETHG